jgi:hypothetical protein
VLLVVATRGGQMTFQFHSWLSLQPGNPAAGGPITHLKMRWTDLTPGSVSAVYSWPVDFLYQSRICARGQKRSRRTIETKRNG